MYVPRNYSLAEAEILKRQLDHKTSPRLGFPTWLLTATAALSLGIGRRWGLRAN